MVSNFRALGVALAVLCLGTTIAGLAAARTQDAAADIDRSLRPGDDFYRYANAAWLTATPLSDGVSRIDTTSMLRAENARRVRSLIEDAAQAASAHTQRTDGAIVQRVGDYFTSWLDEPGIEARGLAPLSADLAAIAAISDGRTLARYLGRSIRLDDGTNQQTESLWGVWIHQGFHDADHYSAHVVQGGLGLSDTDDYLDTAPEHAERRALYRDHVASILAAAGFDQPQARAARILALEIAIARTHASRAETDDVFKTDNTWRRADFVANAPGLDWDAYFSAAELSPSTTFVVWQPQSVIGGARLVATQPLETWKDYLAFHLIEHYAAVLPGPIANARRAFEARLSGASSSPTPDRYQEALTATEAVLGDGVGQLYVARYFSPQAKDAAEAMVANVRTALRTRLQNLTWMAPDTRAKALAKLDALRVGLGFPATWIDYSALAIVRGDAFGNLKRVEAFTYHRELAKLAGPVDPDEWAVQLHPQMVGAILNLSPNSMQFAAGLLQPPYFNALGDAASNYGSAGAGIAHEISHSFDAVGNLYDDKGRLASWWSDGDRAQFATVSAPLGEQLSQCCPQPDACTNGARVLGESSADLIGLNVAHDAYLLSLHGSADVVKNGLTGEQRFFIAFAQRWRRQQTDADLHRQIATDTHAPPLCRADLVRNVDAWASAFHVQPGDRLYVAPETRVRLW